MFNFKKSYNKEKMTETLDGIRLEQNQKNLLKVMIEKAHKQNAVITGLSKKQIGNQIGLSERKVRYLIEDLKEMKLIRERKTKINFSANTYSIEPIADKLNKIILLKEKLFSSKNWRIA